MIETSDRHWLYAAAALAMGGFAWLCLAPSLTGALAGCALAMLMAEAIAWEVAWRGVRRVESLDKRGRLTAMTCGWCGAYLCHLPEGEEGAVLVQCRRCAQDARRKALIRGLMPREESTPPAVAA